MSPRRLPLHRKLIYSTIVFAGVFGFLEIGLRVVGVGRPPVLGKLRFGYETGVPLYDSDGVEEEGVVYQDLPLFERHAELFWRPIANSPFTGPRGLRKPEPEWKVDTDDVLTVLVLGDSCSFLGQSPYASRLTTLLRSDKHPTVRVFNASCPGYSSAQGVLRLKEFEFLKPDVVLVYFGWNDHWRSLNGCTDRVLVERNKFAARTQSLLGHFHFYWLIYGLGCAAAHSRNRPLRWSMLRCEFRWLTMLRICLPSPERAAAWNGRVLLLTAPSAFKEQQYAGLGRSVSLASSIRCPRNKWPTFPRRIDSTTNVSCRLLRKSAMQQLSIWISRLSLARLHCFAATVSISAKKGMS